MPLGDAYQSFMQERTQRGLMQRQAQLQQFQNDRLQKQEMLRMMLFANSPGAQREARLRQLYAQKQQQSQDLDKQWVQALLMSPDSTFAAELRGRLPLYRKWFTDHPEGASKIVQQLMSQGKPHPVQLKPITTVGPDGVTPETRYEVWDPNDPSSAAGASPTVGSSGPTMMPPPPGSGGTSLSLPAPTGGDGLSPEAAKLKAEYGF